ncbi:MAG: CRISPR-associated endonuclease Cas2 [Bacteroidota bacterium]
MPYYVCVYDVSVDRVQKALRLFRRYLTWVQNSVFEGELTLAQYAELEAKAQDLFEAQDSLIVCEMRTGRYVERKVVGVERGETGRFL